ncbi:MAG: glucoamylase family protein [Caldilineaceae bacterium]
MKDVLITEKAAKAKDEQTSHSGEGEQRNLVQDGIENQTTLSDRVDDSPIETLKRLAQSHRIGARSGSGPTLIENLNLHTERIKNAYQHYRERSGQDSFLPYEAEWLLDNYYLIQRVLRQIEEDMPAGYYRQLPKLTEGESAGLPRIFVVAAKIVELSTINVTTENLANWLEAYQSVTPLTMGELWAFPTMLRMALIEALALALAHTSQQFATGEARPDTLTRLAQLIAPENIVAHAIPSLRTLNALEWEDFFEQSSYVERVLRQDPTGIYPQMDFETRNHYREEIEELARSGKRSEVEIARQAIELAKQGSSNVPLPARTGHVGYYLIDQGRETLEQTLAIRPRFGQRLRRWLTKHPTLVYLGGIALVVLILISLFLQAVEVTTFTPLINVLATLAAIIVLLIPFVTVAAAIVNALLGFILKPRTLPKLDFSEGIPDEQRSMVVIPALLGSEQEIDGLLRQLEQQYLSNVDPNLGFALLTDFTDGSAEVMPEDEALLARARTGIEELNRRYQASQEKTGAGDVLFVAPMSDDVERSPYRPFYLFHRRRLWNPSEARWMGWERKRGKLHEFNRLVRGAEDTTYTTCVGDMDFLPAICTVITLDADTQLPFESARRLVATLAHPLNQAVFDEQTMRVVAGYSVLQPRTEIKPTSANHSIFSQIYAGDTGFDLYTHAVSDVYQDLFGQGIYIGKGIYEIDAFERSLADRVPENRLLSHDLFEGGHGRAALVSDIIVYEEYPSRYLVYAKRMHRWIRGDWQLLPWLGPLVPHVQLGMAPNPLRIINRWQIFDNLRRSVLTPSLLLILAVAWLFGISVGGAWVWGIIVAGVLALPVLISVLIWSINALFNGNGSGFVQTMRPSLLRWLLALVLLPYESAVTLDAIGRTLVRLFFTRRQLLQWTPVAASERLLRGANSLGNIWQQMIAGPLVAVVLTGLIAYMHPQILLAAFPWLLAWFFSPQIAYWISQPHTHQPQPLSVEEQQWLRTLARRTWLYFEHFVGPDDNWLPPDHFQENPLGLVAHRTSPTNIGLMLLSTLAAFDFGYDDLLSLLTRIQSSFGTIDKLEKHRGHLLNWYTTRTLETLPPRYVSMVDSGNLAASLWVLRQGLDQMGEDPLLRQQRWQGLADNLLIFSEIVNKLSSSAPEVAEQLHKHLKQILALLRGEADTPCAWLEQIEQFSQREWPQLNQQMIALISDETLGIQPHTLRQLRVSIEQVEHHVQGMQRELDWLAPWVSLVARPPALFTNQPDLTAQWQQLRDQLCARHGLRQMPGVYQGVDGNIAQIEQLIASVSATSMEQKEAQRWCSKLRTQIEEARSRAVELDTLCQQLSHQAEQMVEEMDFGFLYDEHRHLFHIGYNVDAGMLDGNYYDLLASEARAGSLVAIAKGDVPAKHWLHLGRPLTQVNGNRTLLSWSGTMFEYLMPALFTRTYPNTLLQQSIEGAVDAQMQEARTRKLPWGVSEAGFYQFDANLFYQYRAFGTPTLGFKRGLGDDYVVSPYATVLALPFRPQEVVQNLKVLQNLNLLGDYGFYESIDYTENRLPLGQQSAIVRSFMVHHQGMAFLALLNYLDSERMIKRFHADPRIHSVELLLQEQIPYHAPLEESSEQDVMVIPVAEGQVPVIPWPTPVQTPYPRLHYLSNGNFSTLISNSGGGFSRWKSYDLTRWRSDTTQDDWGHWFYLVDTESGETWSLTPQPVQDNTVERQVAFSPHKVEFHATSHQIDSHIEVGVSPKDDVEVRRIQLNNRSDRPRRLAIVSYGEVVLGAQSADRRHPAFNKLFIESELLGDKRRGEQQGREPIGLLFHRRPRSSDESPIFLAYSLLTPVGKEVSSWFESDRRLFLGRDGSLAKPMALQKDRLPQPSNASNATLDPVFSAGQIVELEPGASLEFAFILTACDDRATIDETLRRYRDWAVIHQLFEQSRMQSEMELRQLELTSEELGHIQHLLSLLIYPHPALRARHESLMANQLGQTGLWPFAISGDYPILLVEIADEDEIALVQDLLQAHTYWRNRNLQIDLVILNKKESGYAQEIQGQLHRLLHRTNSDIWLNQRGGIFLLRRDTMNEASRMLLNSAALVILRGEQGNLSEQLDAIAQPRPALPNFQPSVLLPPTPDPQLQLERPTGLQFDNGVGGFSADGHEYLIYLEAGQKTPAPWINVVANEDFGFLISETGMGYTWALNSGENRLTPWLNDPLCDNQGEAIYLRDEETAEIWSPTPLPAREDSPYLVRHGSGYSIFEHQSRGLKQEVCFFVAPDAPVKIVTLRLENPGDRPRRITATYYAEWVLGVNRDEMQQYIIPEYVNEHHALLARNPYNDEFAERVAFLTATQPAHGLTSNRTEFLGVRGRRNQPAALKRIGLSNSVEAGVDPCAAYMVHFDLQAGESRQVHFLLGQGANREESLTLIKRYQDLAQVDEAWQQARGNWQELLTTIQVETPEPTFDLLLNRWLLYQNLACRVWGRSAFYQSSGAYGFRDQLQDVLALVHAKPDVTRAQILRAARHQFEAGDVLHWWHPPSGRGVRTRISDDLLWLPFVTAHYVLSTGDRSILDEQIPFLVGQPLDKSEHERYGKYDTSRQAYSLLEHCRKALKRGQTRGPHGLPLFGGGDWNDGMNRVGMNGKGESVWLGWFLIETLQRFADLCDLLEQAEEATQYRSSVEQLRQALDNSAWDGEWYLRGYYDDGTLLGSSRNQECQIDSIAQSWAVLSATGDSSERAQQAMHAVRQRLVDEEAQLIQLFTPPFDKTKRDPGYIKGYPPGIRENGGQYTHAALWAVWAFARMGDGDTAEALFRLLNPIYHSNDPMKREQYRVEPYVIAADVYSVAPFTGMGGWTWYTGSAGWMYRLGIEGILGLQRRVDHLILDPCIPKAWPGFKMGYRFGTSHYQIEVTNPQGVNRGIKQVVFDEKVMDCKHVPLVDDGEQHTVTIELG